MSIIGDAVGTAGQRLDFGSEVTHAKTHKVEQLRIGVTASPTSTFVSGWRTDRGASIRKNPGDP